MSSFTLSPEALENIKSYRYVTHGLTWIETNFFEYWWNFVVTLLPKNLAPNLMTLLGLVFPII